MKIAKKFGLLLCFIAFFRLSQAPAHAFDECTQACTASEVSCEANADASYAECVDTAQFNSDYCLGQVEVAYEACVNVCTIANPYAWCFNNCAANRLDGAWNCLDQ